MKTTKKGFTLIELIVVIAIIGVLAAILVPAMLGYVKKSKINAANSDCKTLITTYNAAIEEMDEEGEKCAPGWYGHGSLADSDGKLDQYLGYYSDAALSGNYAVYVADGGAAICSVSKSGKYYGTYPAFITNKNYDKNKYTADGKSAITDSTVLPALKKYYEEQHPGVTVNLGSKLPEGLNTKTAK